MEWIGIAWLTVLCLLCFLAYLSFSLITRDAVTVLAQCLEPTEYKFTPLSRMCPDPRKLTSLLSFSRLLFALPILLVVHQWTNQFGVIIASVALICVIVLLYRFLNGCPDAFQFHFSKELLRFLAMFFIHYFGF